MPRRKPDIKFEENCDKGQSILNSKKHSQGPRPFQRKRLLGFATVRILLAITMLLPLAVPVLAAPSLQTDSPEALAQAVLDSMTPQERVGQLFLVTFEGNEITEESAIYDLITQYHIGGVVLNRELDNFVDAPNTLQSAYNLIFDIQQAERSASESEQSDLQSGESFTPVYVPILVGLSQEGDGYPNDQLLNALSPQPNAMTLGATWQAELAAQAGEVLGRELAALGVNLLLGPSLDVLESPSPESLGDIGVRSFGGDPYWVGQMGQAYIRGVHLGSNNQVAVVSKHLPGFGSGDRPLDEEIPTIRKSLSQLSQIELAPFFAVTGSAPSPESQTDAMLLAHIRYQGFQGNIRATTRPVSFDPQAFSELMALADFADWRDQGGLIISDQLGTRAVRRHYDVSEQVFNASLVARDAFLAGNDILYLGNFVSSGDPDNLSSIIDTSNFFTQKYREDLAFAERVNESVLRILTLKFKLYPTFNISLVMPSTLGLEEIGGNTELIFEIGRQAATLLSPEAINIPNVLPEKPQLTEQIIFIVDSLTATQCGECAENEVLSLNALEIATETLYGPLADNQVAPGNISSYSFHQAMVALDEVSGEENLFLDSLNSAEWVIFAVQNLDINRPDSFALQRLLSERPDLIQNKIVIVFALNAPYYLDATDITKISAYYGLYSKQEEMADIIARLLFQEISAPGASPVSVDGTGYELIAATSPDPARVIPLEVSLLGAPNGQVSEEGEPNTQSTGTPNIEAATSFQAGDLLDLRAGPILDSNGNPVPDSTPVTFSISISAEGGPLLRLIEASTVSGSAQVSYSIESEGSLEISAVSGSTQAISDIQQFDVIGINPEGISEQATQASNDNGESNGSGEASEIAEESSSEEDNLSMRASFTDWVLAVAVSLFISLFAYQLGSASVNVRWGVRWALWAFIGGMISISYMSLGLSGSAGLIESWGIWGVVFATFLGSVIGWLIAWLWRSRASGT